MGETTYSPLDPSAGVRHLPDVAVARTSTGSTVNVGVTVTLGGDAWPPVTVTLTPNSALALFCSLGQVLGYPTPPASS